MRNVRSILAALLCLPALCAAQSHGIPQAFNLRYSAQISNASAGSCGCFALHGVAGDVYWGLRNFHAPVSFGLVADAGVEHTGTVGNADFGLTLTTLTAGPRFTFPAHRVQIFGQALFGLAHGSGSEFPQGNTLVPSANSFAYDLGGAADYAINSRFSFRVAQLDFLRTALPNTTSNWQNNLRVGAGLTMHFGSR
jgi:hypothetical protein